MDITVSGNVCEIPAPRGQSTYGRVSSILSAAGYRQGQRHAHSLKGELLNESRAGYVLDFKHDDAGPKLDGLFGSPRRIIVDHQGKGQKAAIERYADALRAGGLTVEVRAKWASEVAYNPKPKMVVWVIAPLNPET